MNTLPNKRQELPVRFAARSSAANRYAG